MTFLAWKPGHMITFLVCFCLFLFFLYWDFRLTRIIDKPGRENGGDVDNSMLTADLLQPNYVVQYLINPPSIKIFLCSCPSIPVNKRLDAEEQIKHYHITRTMRNFSSHSHAMCVGFVGNMSPGAHPQNRKKNVVAQSRMV